MKTIRSMSLRLLTIFLLLLLPVRAEQRNGFLVTVQKTTLTRDDYRGPGYFDDKIDRTLGLKINLKNITMKPMEAGTLDYTILVFRWGYSPIRYERYTGTVEVPALKPQEVINLVAGNARLGGYKNYSNRQYQDKIEAWKIVIKQGGVEKVSFMSNSSFEALNKKAVAASQ